MREEREGLREREIEKELGIKQKLCRVNGNGMFFAQRQEKKNSRKDQRNEFA